MCGIVGILDIKTRREVDRSVLVRMNETQHHRGPDDGGMYTEPGLGFAHRRLSVIDLEGGKQPLLNRRHGIVVTHNGEIFNFRELRVSLQTLGYEFTTDSDTEVIAFAWQAWGERCVERFRGMFAFALWDRSKETLFLARDRIGIKPLFYAFSKGGHFLFSSELKALREHPGLCTSLDPSAIEDFFAFGYIPDPKTIYKDARKLPPGFHLTLRRGDMTANLKRYWDIPFQVDAAMDEAGALEQMILRLRAAVHIAMVSDVPIGAFLSGGVDSSAVVSMMAERSDAPITTCSISFGDPRFNESGHAFAVARRYRTQHWSEQAGTADPGLIDRLANCYDEPYADSSALPTLQVCELARRHVTVALSGDGGDELFAGYRRYRWHSYEDKVRALLPARLRRPLFGLMGRAYPKADWAPRALRAKSTFEALALDALEGYFRGVSIMHPGLRSSLWSGRLRSELQGYGAIEVLREHARNSPTEHPLSSLQYLDMKTYLPGDILTKIDRVSMAHGLEVRVPLLDHELVEWGSSVPPHFKLRRSQGKYLLKRALSPYLPHDILQRPKMGFSVPLACWFRGTLKERARLAILGPVMGESGLFNMDHLKRLLDQHQ